MIQLESHAEGTVLPVRVHAGARRNALRAAPDGALGVCVSQAPEKGKANKAIVELLAKTLSLRKSQIELLSGHVSRQKRFLVRGLSVPELSAKIDKAMADAGD